MQASESGFSKEVHSSKLIDHRAVRGFSIFILFFVPVIAKDSS